MFGLGLSELLVVMIIVIVFFGATRLPQIGKGLGEGIRNFRDAAKEPPRLDEKTATKSEGPASRDA
jgi:sec-independent protein translocase protein TatA